MAETHQDSGGGGDFDLSQFYQIFFEEAGENLDQMEQMLLNLNLETADDEELNGIFRCAHSVKGGAATFGFADVAELTHQMESLLDRLRRHELQPNAAMVDVLLQSADASRSLLARHQAGDEGEALPTADLVKRISVLAAGGTVEIQKAPVAITAIGGDQQGFNKFSKIQSFLRLNTRQKFFTPGFKKTFEKREGEKLTFTPLIIECIIKAIKES